MTSGPDQFLLGLDPSPHNGLRCREHGGGRGRGVRPRSDDAIAGDVRRLERRLLILGNGGQIIERGNENQRLGRPAGNHSGRIRCIVDRDITEPDLAHALRDRLRSLNPADRKESKIVA